MSTGGGHSPLQESMATLGVPTMTKRSFIAAEKRIGEWWSTLLEDSMRQAGQQERQIAITKNRTCLGDPAITVILDGGWSKRAHKHSYNAKSGVGVIIGLETQKILFMGVRNKYCSICSHTDDPPLHSGYKNWDGSSSAMESSIIAEGFQKCIQQHGVKYSKFIGDGDSSVWSTLVSAVPWGFAIEKVECANHSVKCFRTQLENLVSNNPSYKGRGKLTEAMRKLLTRAARCVIVMRSKEPDRTTAIIKLQQDLMNGPLHCFGCHTNCSIDFCKTAQKHKNTNTNNSPSTSAASVSPPIVAVNTPTISTPTPTINMPTTSTSPAPSDSSTNTPQLDLLPTTLSASASSSGLHPPDECPDDLDDLMTEQAQHWIYATSDECLDEVRDIPEEDLQNIDMGMICDIQRAVSRLVSKAPQLIGKLK